MSRRCSRILLAAGALFVITLSGCGDDPTSVQPDTGPRVWHVPGDWPTLSAAADTAHAGDVIELAAGVYFEHDIFLEAGVDLRGATGKAADVVLDGQSLGRVLTVAPDTVSAEHSDTTSVITNLVFRNGFGGNHGGGGLLARATVEIRNCRFLSNTSTGPGAGLAVSISNAVIAHCDFDSNAANPESGEGGGLALLLFADQQATVDSCSFTGNTSTGGGGGAYLSGPIEVTNSTFLGNTSYHGGGVLLGGAASLADCLFRDNLATHWTAPDTNGYGGAVYVTNSRQELLRCDFQGNAALHGSAIYGFSSNRIQVCTFTGNLATGSGTVTWAGDCDPEFVLCRFEDNQAEYGGAFSVFAGVNARFIDCRFDGNTAGGGGVGLFHDQGAVTLLICQVTNNTAMSMGGAFANFGNSFSSPATLVLTDCTVSGNSATVSGGVFFFGDQTALTATGVTFTNNTAPEFSGGFVSPYSTAFLTCCEITDHEFGGPGTVRVDDEDCGKGGF